MAKRYLGYGYTNAQGIAKLEYDADGNALTHSYTGVGAGKIDIVAESGSLESEEYSILDCMFYDRGSQGTHSTQYVNYQSLLDVTYTSDYTSIKENSESAGRYSVVDGNNNYLRLPFGTRFECDIKIVDGSASETPFRVMNADATSNLSSPTCTQLGLTVGEWGTFALDIQDDGMYIDDTKIRNLPNATTSAVAIAFWTYGTISEIQFKNLKIYPI